LAHFSIKSTTHAAQSAAPELFHFIGDFNNFKHLLPEDKIENFTCTADSCSFNIRGITPLNIRIKEKVPFNRVSFQTEGLAKFSFTLHAHLNEGAHGKASCMVELEGDLNPFIKAMAEKPLTQLVNTMAEKLAQQVL